MPAAAIIVDATRGPERQKFYQVRCACGRACKFWRWSWLTRGAERCRACHALVLTPTASPLLSLRVVAAPTVGEFWNLMDWDEQVAAVRQLAASVIEGVGPTPCP